MFPMIKGKSVVKYKPNPILVFGTVHDARCSVCKKGLEVSQRKLDFDGDNYFQVKPCFCERINIHANIKK